MVEEVVKSENEPQYDTMCGIGDEVFGTKKGGGICLYFSKYSIFVEL